MTRTIYYTATSVDGFIADPEQTLDWLLSRRSDPGGPLDYDTFMGGVGALVMGATTYEWVLRHLDRDEDGAVAWPYDVPAWVVTHRDLPGVPGKDVRFHSGDIAALHDEMVAAADGRDVWVVGGGDLAGQFADQGRLDELVVTIAPVTLGAGAPLCPRRLELRLEESGRNGEFLAARFSVLPSQP